MQRDVPAAVNGSTVLVPLKSYVDEDTLREVKARGTATGLGSSGYLRMLVKRDLATPHGYLAEQPVPYPANRSKVVKAYVEDTLWEQAEARANVRRLSISKYLLELVLRDRLNTDDPAHNTSALHRPDQIPGLEAA